MGAELTDASAGEIVDRISEAIADGSLWAAITHGSGVPFRVDDASIYSELEEIQRREAEQRDLAVEAEIEAEDAKLKRLIAEEPSHVWGSQWSSDDQRFALALLRAVLRRGPNIDPRAFHDRIREPIVSRYRRHLRRADKARLDSFPKGEWHSSWGPTVDRWMAGMLEVQMKNNPGADPRRSWFETQDSYGPSELNSLRHVLRLYRLGEPQTPAEILYWAMREYRWRTDPKLATSRTINAAVINSAVNVVTRVASRAPRTQAVRPKAPAPVRPSNARPAALAEPFSPIPSDGLAPLDLEASFQVRLNRGGAPSPGASRTSLRTGASGSIANATDLRDGSPFDVMPGGAPKPAGKSQTTQAANPPAPKGEVPSTQAPRKFAHTIKRTTGAPARQDEVAAVVRPGNDQPTKPHAIVPSPYEELQIIKNSGPRTEFDDLVDDLHSGGVLDSKDYKRSVRVPPTPAAEEPAPDFSDPLSRKIDELELPKSANPPKVGEISPPPPDYEAQFRDPWEPEPHPPPLQPPPSREETIPFWVDEPPSGPHTIVDVPRLDDD